MGKVHWKSGARMVPSILPAYCACASASEPSLDISQYAHTAWIGQSGFYLGNINAMAQAPDTRLQPVAEFELARFDGLFTVPRRPHTGKHFRRGCEL